ncbi:MAG: YihY/virulence factor BrkB family protein [Geminicoccaceae bacterium]|nr:YihY/virulence factor BrkB family protein [Geminicoccaceae bacterium]
MAEDAAAKKADGGAVPLDPNGPGATPDPAWLKRLPRIGRIAYRATDRLINHDGLEISGNIAFTAFTALFPFLIFLAALAGFLGSLEAAEQVIDLMFRFMPDDVAATLAPAVKEVMVKRSGGLLTFGIVVTLWTASNGIESLRLALSRAYGVREYRPLWFRRLQSLLFVVIGAFVIFLLSLSILLGPIVWQIAEHFVGLGDAERLVWVIARYGFASSLLFIGLVALHHWLPHHDWPLRAALPGIFLTLLLWIIGASLFSYYLGTIGNYTVTYGSLGGVVITLFFFYITATLFIFGAEFNAVLREAELKRRLAKMLQQDGDRKKGN